jgi:hypothetical protein
VVGGRSVSDDFSRRLFEAAGSTLEKDKSSGRKYFEARGEATKSLNPQQLSAWEAYNQSENNFLGEKIFESNSEAKNQARASAYVQFPELFEVDKEIDAKSRANGEPGNPFFDLPFDKALLVAQQKALPPGATDQGINTIYNESWYEQFKDAESAYYDQIFKDKQADPNNPYENETPEQQQAIENYYSIDSTYKKGQLLGSNPDLARLLSNRKEYQNKQRAEIGLPPLPNNYLKYLDDSQESNNKTTVSSKSTSSKSSRKPSARLGYRLKTSIGASKTSPGKLKVRKVSVKTKAKDYEPKFAKQQKIKIKTSKA